MRRFSCIPPSTLPPYAKHNFNERARILLELWTPKLVELAHDRQWEPQGDTSLLYVPSEHGQCFTSISRRNFV